MKYSNPLSSIPQPIQGYIDYLLLNVYSLSSSGLYEGKMGFAIVLFELSRFDNNEYLEEQAYEVLKEALVSKQEDCSLDHGLAGIGYGLLYLIQNKFIEADFKELFEEQHLQVIKHIKVLLEQSINVIELTSLLNYLYAYQLYSKDTDMKVLAGLIKSKVVRLLAETYNKSVEDGIYSEVPTSLVQYQTQYFLKTCCYTEQYLDEEFFDVLLKFIEAKYVVVSPLILAYLSVLKRENQNILTFIEKGYDSVLSSLKFNFLSSNEYIDLHYFLKHTSFNKVECSLSLNLRDKFRQVLPSIDIKSYPLVLKHNISFASGLPRHLLHYVYQESKVINSLINPFI